jgi:hypothetical protein
MKRMPPEEQITTALEIASQLQDTFALWLDHQRTLALAHLALGIAKLQSKNPIDCLPDAMELLRQCETMRQDCL